MNREYLNLKIMKTHIFLSILFFSVSFCFSQSSNSKDCPVTIFYGLNESHSTDWAKCTKEGLIGISYYNKSNQNLYYKTIQPDGYENEEVVATGEHLEICVLLIDSYSKPHIFVASSNDLEQTIKHYFKNTNNQWENELIVSFYNEGGKFIYELSADIGSDDSFHLLVLKTPTNPDSENYYDAFKNAHLYYITNADGSWQKELINIYDTIWTLDEYSKNMNRQDITVDSEGFVHVIFGEQINSSSRLYYTTNKSGVWTSEIASDYLPGTRDDGGWYSSICLDNNDIPYISCTYIGRVSSGSAMYAKLLFVTRNTDGTWNLETVANADDGYYGSDGRDYTGGITHLVFDKYNKPHIIFTDIASSHAGMNYLNLGNIRHAVKENDEWNITTIYRQALPSAFFNATEMYSMCLLISENTGKIQVIGQELTVSSSTNYNVELINVVVEQGNSIEDEAKENSLLNIYPNPVKNETTISFDLISAKNSMLLLYNLNGEIIYDFCNQKLINGENIIIFNTENLVEEIYFIKLFTSGKNYVNKMILVK